MEINELKRQLTLWRTVAIIAIIVLLIVTAIYSSGSKAPSPAAETPAPTAEASAQP